MKENLLTALVSLLLGSFLTVILLYDTKCNVDLKLTIKGLIDEIKLVSKSVKLNDLDENEKIILIEDIRKLKPDDMFSIKLLKMKGEYEGPFEYVDLNVTLKVAKDNDYLKTGTVCENSKLKNQRFVLRIRSKAKSMVDMNIGNKYISDCTKEDMDSTIWVNKEVFKSLLSNNVQIPKTLQVIARRIDYI